MRTSSRPSSSFARADELSAGSCSHQSIPIERAVSADAIRSRSFSVSSSMSSSCTVTSPAITTPLSSSRSTSSTVTVQPRGPSRTMPEIASTGLPKSSSTCWRASRAISAGERFFAPFLLAMVEPVEELAFDRLVLVLGQLAALERGPGLGELEPDPPRVAQLRVGLVHDLLEHPGDAAHGREGKRQQAADETHQAATGSARS